MRGREGETRRSTGLKRGKEEESGEQSQDVGISQGGKWKWEQSRMAKYPYSWLHTTEVHSHSVAEFSDQAKQATKQD